MHAIWAPPSMLHGVAAGRPASTMPPDWMTVLLHVSVWTSLVMTVYSGWEYIQIALRLVR